VHNGQTRRNPVTENRTTTDSGRRSGLSRLAGNLALAALALLIGLLVCEIALRLLGVSYPVFVWTDPVRGVAHIPGAKSSNTYNGHSWVEINKDGWRGPDTPLKAPAGTFRIALLGDSYIEAFEVPYEKTAGQVLQRSLAAARRTPVEVLNFGHGGYGTTQEMLTLQHDVWKYSPDLVLLAVTTGNDISDNYRPLKRSDYTPYYVFQGDSLVLDTTFLASRGYRSRALWTRRLLLVVQHSRLAQLVNRVRHLGRREERQDWNRGGAPGDEVGLRDEVMVPPTTSDWQTAWKVTEGILRMMRDECRKKNTPFAVVTLSRGIQVTPNKEKKEKFLSQLGAKDLYYPERRLDEFGKREGIPVFNLAPPMAKLAEERHVFFHADHGTPGIGHWTEEGNRIAGELIASWLAGDWAGRPTTVSQQP
jgi:hypothetical protein